jgi:hypothetical protein
MAGELTIGCAARLRASSPGSFECFLSGIFARRRKIDLAELIDEPARGDNFPADESL